MKLLPKCMQMICGKGNEAVQMIKNCYSFSNNEVKIENPILGIVE